ncbi:MAG: nitroreductase family protein [Coriobacteriia bacterium]|nr:nitroreductase family protein [Coriobacteriia bacterium]
MNETLKTIAERHTTRSFTGTPVEREKLDAILLAGAQAPTAANSQRFRLIATDNKEFIDEIEAKLLADFEATNPAMMERIKERGGKVLYNASAVIFIAIDDQGPWSAHLDAGIVVENMALAASSLEVGNCIFAMFRTLFEGDGAEEMKQKLQFPEGFTFAVGLLLGYATDFGKPHEPAIDKIIWL